MPLGLAALIGCSNLRVPSGFSLLAFYYIYIFGFLLNPT